MGRVKGAKGQAHLNLRIFFAANHQRIGDKVAKTIVDTVPPAISLGMTPDTLGEFYEYVPTLTEVRIGAGIFAIGFLIFTVLCKIAIPILQESEEPGSDDVPPTEVALP